MNPIGVAAVFWLGYGTHCLAVGSWSLGAFFLALAALTGAWAWKA